MVVYNTLVEEGGRKIGNLLPPLWW